MDEEKRYAVHADGHGHHAWEAVWAFSADEAAIDFAARWAGQPGVVRVFVTDCESGHEACFTIDLHDGELESCGDLELERAA